MSDVKKNLRSNRPLASFPDWRDRNAYEGYQDWSNRRWAWEFLRRNDEYRKTCARFRVTPAREGRSASAFGRKEERKKAAAQFGRCDLKHYLEPYGHDDKGRNWLAESIVDWAAGTSDEGEQVEHFLLPGQVSIVFDLTQTEVAGTAAIAVLMEHARQILDGELTRYVERHLKGPRGAAIRRDPNLKPKPKHYKPKRDVETRLKWLRIYDALEIQGAPRRDVIEEYFSHLTGDPNDPEGGKVAGIKALSKTYRRAVDIVMGEYKEWIPLDYLRRSEPSEEDVAPMPQ